MRFLHLLAFLLLPFTASADVKDKIAALSPKALVLAVDEQGHELVAQNADAPFVPASVAKIVTAWLAMQVLGPDYRFETRFYLDADRKLYIKGGGDPFLISEELGPLAQDLVAKIGRDPISGIVVDGGYYPADLAIPGIEKDALSYNAANTALAVNFNTIAAARSGDDVRPGEPQTPLTPLAISEFRARGPNGAGRISLSETPELGELYAGELIAAFLEKAGGSVKGEVTLGAVPAGLDPVYVHQQSRPLREIIIDLMTSSNNYIANQVFLEIGAHKLGAPVSLDKSLKVLDEALAAQGLTNDIHLLEGSGISRDDRFTARGLAKILALFVPNARLLRGHDGGLDKTGTMDGVRTLAGYADSKKHGRLRFVISAPGNDGALRFRLLKLLETQL
jgi:D-alanyl-D-alanine carboxypeptidase/D-alanyl-D-alanine-endopeptidase (penicillin-binding protein 4)